MPYRPLLLLTPTSLPPPILSLLRMHGYTPYHVPCPTTTSLASIIDDFSSSTPYGIIAFDSACAPALELAEAPQRMLKVVVVYNPGRRIRGRRWRDGVEVVVHCVRNESGEPMQYGSSGAGEHGECEGYGNRRPSLIESAIYRVTTGADTIDGSDTGVSEIVGTGHGHLGKWYYYSPSPGSSSSPPAVPRVDPADPIALTRTLTILQQTLGGCEGAEDAVDGATGGKIEGVRRRVVGVDGVVDEGEGWCVVRDVAGGVVTGQRVYWTEEGWMRERARRMGEESVEMGGGKGGEGEGRGVECQGQ